MRSRAYVPFIKNSIACALNLATTVTISRSRDWMGDGPIKLSNSHSFPLARCNSSTKKRRADAPSRPVASTLNVKYRYGVKRVISGKESSW
jgi:hypothetical protein